MKTPEQLLSNVGWRLLHSTWMLWGVLSLGIFAFIGFLYTGIRMRDPLRFILSAFGFLLSSMAFVAAPRGDEPATALSTTLSSLMILWWIGSSIGAFFMNRKWLVWKANRGEEWTTTAPTAPSWTAPAATPRVVPVQTAPAQFVAAPPAQPQYAQSGLLDLNSASREQLLALPGINAEWADYLIAAREKNGGFDDKNELVIDAQMPPHMYLQIRDLVTATPRTP